MNPSEFWHFAANISLARDFAENAVEDIPLEQGLPPELEDIRRLCMASVTILSVAHSQYKALYERMVTENG